MLALTLAQLFWWAVIIVGGFVGLVLVLWAISSGVTRWGRWWTYSGVLLVAATVAALVVLPLHQGDGRSTSYNDGWDFVASSPAGSFNDLYGSLSCFAIFQGEATNGPSTFVRAETLREWVHGCQDARAAMRLAEQNATIPVKVPR